MPPLEGDGPAASPAGLGNGSAAAALLHHEGTSLLHPETWDPSRQNFLNRYRRDARSWVRIPSEAVHLAYATIVSNYVNVLLIFVPLGIISPLVGWSPSATFVLNFLAIIPLASLLSFATEELAATMGETMGGLLNATFGNAVELIVSLLYSDFHHYYYPGITPP